MRFRNELPSLAEVSLYMCSVSYTPLRINSGLHQYATSVLTFGNSSFCPRVYASVQILRINIGHHPRSAVSVVLQGGGPRFLGAFPKIGEKCLLVSLCLSVRLAVRMEQLGPHWADFPRNLVFDYFTEDRRGSTSVIIIWQ